MALTDEELRKQYEKAVKAMGAKAHQERVREHITRNPYYVSVAPQQNAQTVVNTMPIVNQAMRNVNRQVTVPSVAPVTPTRTRQQFETRLRTPTIANPYVREQYVRNYPEFRSLPTDVALNNQGFQGDVGKIPGFINQDKQIWDEELSRAAVRLNDENIGDTMKKIRSLPEIAALRGAGGALALYEGAVQKATNDLNDTMTEAGRNYERFLADTVYNTEATAGQKANEYYTAFKKHQTNEPVNTDGLGYILLDKADKKTQELMDGLNGTEQFFVSTMISALQNMEMMPLLLVPGAGQALTLAGMSMSAAGNTMAERAAQGKDINDAFLAGVLDGTIEAATEMIGVDNFVKMLSGKAGGVLKSLLVQAGSEAGEEGLSYLAGLMIDIANHEPDAKFSMKELATQMLSGALSGAMLGGVGMVGGMANMTADQRADYIKNAYTYERTADQIEKLKKDLPEGMLERMMANEAQTLAEEEAEVAPRVEPQVEPQIEPQVEPTVAPTVEEQTPAPEVQPQAEAETPAEVEAAPKEEIVSEEYGDEYAEDVDEDREDFEDETPVEKHTEPFTPTKEQEATLKKIQGDGDAVGDVVQLKNGGIAVQAKTHKIDGRPAYTVIQPNGKWYTTNESGLAADGIGGGIIGEDAQRIAVERINGHLESLEKLPPKSKNKVLTKLHILSKWFTDISTDSEAFADGTSRINKFVNDWNEKHPNDKLSVSIEGGTIHVGDKVYSAIDSAAPRGREAEAPKIETAKKPIEPKPKAEKKTAEPKSQKKTRTERRAETKRKVETKNDMEMATAYLAQGLQASKTEALNDLDKVASYLSEFSSESNEWKKAVRRISKFIGEWNYNHPNAEIFAQFDEDKVAIEDRVYRSIEGQKAFEEETKPTEAPKEEKKPIEPKTEKKTEVKPKESAEEDKVEKSLLKTMKTKNTNSPPRLMTDSGVTYLVHPEGYIFLSLGEDNFDPNEKSRSMMLGTDKLVAQDVKILTGALRDRDGNDAISRFKTEKNFGKITESKKATSLSGKELFMVSTEDNGKTATAYFDSKRVRELQKYSKELRLLPRGDIVTILIGLDGNGNITGGVFNENVRGRENSILIGKDAGLENPKKSFINLPEHYANQATADQVENATEQAEKKPIEPKKAESKKEATPKPKPGDVVDFRGDKYEIVERKPIPRNQTVDSALRNPDEAVRFGILSKLAMGIPKNNYAIDEYNKMVEQGWADIPIGNGQYIGRKVGSKTETTPVVETKTEQKPKAEAEPKRDNSRKPGAVTVTKVEPGTDINKVMGQNKSEARKPMEMSKAEVKEETKELQLQPGQTRQDVPVKDGGNKYTANDLESYDKEVDSLTRGKKNDTVQVVRIDGNWKESFVVSGDLVFKVDPNYKSGTLTVEEVNTAKGKDYTDVISPYDLLVNPLDPENYIPADSFLMNATNEARQYYRVKNQLYNKADVEKLQKISYQLVYNETEDYGTLLVGVDRDGYVTGYITGTTWKTSSGSKSSEVGVTTKGQKPARAALSRVNEQYANLSGEQERVDLVDQNKAKGEKLDPKQKERVVKELKAEKRAEEFSEGIVAKYALPPDTLIDLHKAAKRAKGIYTETMDWFNRVFNPSAKRSRAEKDIFFDYKGDNEKALAQLQKQMKPLKKLFDSMSYDENMEFIDNYQNGIPQATQELQEIDEFIRKTIEPLTRGLLEIDPNAQMRENYLPQIWRESGKTVKTAEEQIRRKRGLVTDTSFRKQRIYDTYYDGINAGLTPRTVNPIELVEHIVAAETRYITAHKMFNKLKEYGYIKFVAQNKPVPDGYEEIDDHLFKVYYPTEIKRLGEIGRYVAKEGTAQMLHNWVMPNSIRNTSLGETLADAKNAVTRFELAFSGFHYIQTYMTALQEAINMGMQNLINAKDISGIRGLIDPVGSTVKTQRQGAKLIELALDRDSFMKNPDNVKWLRKNPIAEQFVDLYWKGGGKLSHNTYEEMGKRAERSWREILRDFSKTRNPNDAFRTSFEVINKFNSGFTRPLFEKIIPQLKMGFFYAQMLHDMKVYENDIKSGQKSMTELARSNIDTMDDLFGAMNYDNRNWNRNMKQLLQIAFRSPTWWYGNVHMGRGILKENFYDNPKRLLTKGQKMVLGKNTGFAVSMLYISAVVGSMIHLAMTGKPPEDWKDMIAPQTGELDRNGEPVRFSAPGYIKSWINLYTNPVQSATSATSGFYDAVFRMAKNRDFYGNYIHDPSDPRLQQATDILTYLARETFAPFTLSNAYEDYVNATDDNGNTDWEAFLKTALPDLAGLSKAPKIISQSKFKRDVRKRYEGTNTYVAQPGSPKDKKTREEKAVLRQKIFDGTATDEEVQKAIKDGIISTASARSAKMYTFAYQWSYLPKTTREDLWDEASDREKQALAMVERKKEPDKQNDKFVKEWKNGDLKIPGQDQFSKSKLYKNASFEQTQNAIRFYYQYQTNKLTAKYEDKKEADTYNSVKRLIANGYSEYDACMVREMLKDVEGTKNEKGKTISLSRRNNRINKLIKMGYSKAEAEKIVLTYEGA